MRSLLTSIAALIFALTASLPVALAQSEMDEGTGNLSSFAVLEGFYTRALGNLSPTFPSASGGYLGYGRHFPEHMVGIARIGYSNYKVSDDAQGEQKLNIVHLLAGPRYYFVTAGVMPFIFLNVGLNIVTEILNQPNFSSDRTSAQFAWQVGVGGSAFIFGPFGVDLQAKYNSHFLYHEGSSAGVENRGNMTGLEYGLGLTWALR